MQLFRSIVWSRTGLLTSPSSIQERFFQTHIRSRSTHFCLISSSLISISFVNTKTLLRSLALCQKKVSTSPPFRSSSRSSNCPACFSTLPRRQEILQWPKLSSQAQTRTVSPSKRSISPWSNVSLGSSIFSVNRTL